MNENANDTAAGEEQVIYANLLAKGMYIGLLVLFVTFAIYTLGIMKPGVPVEELAEYWHLDVHTYLETVEENHLHQGHLVTGWSWLKLLGKADYLNFLGVAILSFITIICFLAIIPVLLKKNDKVYATIAFIEALVLLLAASGILAVGH